MKLKNKKRETEDISASTHGSVNGTQDESPHKKKRVRETRKESGDKEILRRRRSGDAQSSFLKIKTWMFHRIVIDLKRRLKCQM
jgi:hypothetical protein